jgi:nickel/cobalt transporter (NicO) family protein
MRRALMLLGLAVAALLALLWLTGGFAALQAQVLEGQRQVQSALAGAVRAIKGGQPGAILGLLSVCFTYGVLHAAGPGHGKLVIGGYGMGRRIPVLRLSGLALAASLAQAAVAVALVYTVVALLGLGRAQAEGLAEDVMAPVGLAMVAGVGLWLVWRGIRGMRADPGLDHHQGHDHDHGHNHGHSHGKDGLCAHCGHAHGPTVEQATQLTGWRDTALLIAGIAARPCSGALFLLILTWQLGIGAAGIAGTFAMGLGTAVVTMAVALLAVWAREGALASLPGQGAARALPWIEALAGAVVTLAALSLLWQAL